MYKETTRGALSPMQTIADRGSNNVSSQTRTIAFLAVFLFAFSGLISGFAVGAFIHPKQVLAVMPLLVTRNHRCKKPRDQRQPVPLILHF